MGENERVVDLSKSRVSIHPETLFRLLWTILAFGVTAAVGAGKFAWDANAELRDLRGSIESATREMTSRTNDRWTLSMQRKYTDDLERKNPTIQVPDVDNIQTKLQVK